MHAQAPHATLPKLGRRILQEQRNTCGSPRINSIPSAEHQSSSGREASILTMEMTKPETHFCLMVRVHELAPEFLCIEICVYSLLEVDECLHTLVNTPPTQLTSWNVTAPQESSYLPLSLNMTPFPPR